MFKRIFVYLMNLFYSERNDVYTADLVIESKKKNKKKNDRNNNNNDDNNSLERNCQMTVHSAMASEGHLEQV